MNVQRISAFSYNGQGGNPAGVVISETHPSETEMLATAAAVGYSETAFIMPFKDGWRVRYFAPELEVPFCGHATIASGAALADHAGEGVHKLYLNDSEISVEAAHTDEGLMVALQSPKTWSAAAPQSFIDAILPLFGLTTADLNSDYPIRFAFAGAKHLILVANSRETVANMTYQYEPVQALMLEQDLITISLLWFESDSVVHSRNAFASGGVYEDPATGAAAAALAGYLRDINWQGNPSFTIIQGVDMGVPSKLQVSFQPEAGSSIRVAGTTRQITESGV